MGRSWRLRPSPRHLTEETLVQWLDGELGGRGLKQTARHLRECWECRALAQRLDTAIHAFVEERRDHLRQMDDRADAGAGFARRLRQWDQAQASAVTAPTARGFRWRRLWPFGLAAAAALAAVEGWKPVAEYLRPPVAREIALERPAPPAAPRIALATRPVTVVSPLSAPLALPEPLPAGPLQLGPTAEDLDAAELSAYFALHDTGLCRGEDVEVLRVPGRGVRISGVVEESVQRARLEAALSAVRYVEVGLVVASAARAPAVLGREAPILRLEPRPALLWDRIERSFLRQSPPNQAVQAMNEFSNQAVLLASTGRWEAQALHRLTAAFPSHRVRAMTPSSRTRLYRIVEEHRREMELSLAQLGRLLDRLVEPGEELETPPPVRFPVLAEGCESLDREAERADYLVSGLFAGLDLPGQDAGQAWRELRETHARAQLLVRASELAAREEFQQKAAVLGEQR